MSASTILVVDDDPETISTFAYALRASGRRVVTAATGESAVHAGREVAPDVIVCDLRLSDMSGLHVCRTLRDSGVDAPIVIVTGFATMDAALEAGRLGATHFLEKPITLDELITVVNRQLAGVLSGTPTLGYDAQMRRIAQVVDHHLAQAHLSVGTVASQVHLSKQHVCRVVKKRQHMTFAAFVREQRVRAARRLLEQTSLTIKDIAFRVGFRSDSRFVRTFRDVTNLSPADYRRRHGG